MKKKMIILTAACVILAGANGVAAAAHGHNSSNTAKNAAVCTVKTCTKTGSHHHSLKSNTKHKTENGHRYHNDSAGHGKNHH